MSVSVLWAAALLSQRLLSLSAQSPGPVAALKG